MSAFTCCNFGAISKKGCTRTWISSSLVSKMRRKLLQLNIHCKCAMCTCNNVYTFYVYSCIRYTYNLHIHSVRKLEITVMEMIDR